MHTADALYSKNENQTCKQAYDVDSTHNTEDAAPIPAPQATFFGNLLLV